jgi:hypothetical protein
MVRSLVHVGLGKTGSTKLQEHLFAREPGLICLGRPYHTGPEYVRAFHMLTRAEAHEVDWSWLERFFGEAKAAAERAGGTVVLSDETLVPAAPLQSVLAERLRRVCPEAEIVVTLRNQPSMIVSFYRSHGRLLKWAPRSLANRPVAFGEWLEFELGRLDESFLGLLRYDRVVGAYESCFGANRVHVLVYEEMVRDLSAYASRWASLLEIKAERVHKQLDDEAVNLGPTDRQLAYDRLRGSGLGTFAANLIPFRGLFGPWLKKVLASGKRDAVRLDDNQQQAVARLFGPGNASLEARRQLGLNRYGYPMPSCASAQLG